jgi:hypothetical protein
VSENATSARVGLLFLAAVIGFLMLQGLASLNLETRELVDTDGYMRSVRAAELLSGESGWFDGGASRSNAPFGHSMHWTRPMDAVLVGAGLPWTLAGAGATEAVYWGSVVAGPLLMIAIGIAVAWAGSPLLGRAWAPVTGAVAVAQPAITAYTAPGRSDHHALILLAGAVTAGAVIRVLIAQQATRFGWIAGIWMGVGLWVSVESLFVVAVAGLALGFAWSMGVIRSGDGVIIWSSAAVTTTIGWLAERGLDVGSVEYDRVSIVHVVLMILVAAAWWLGTGIGDRFRGPVSRLWSLVAVTGATAAVAVALFPGLVSGPFAAVPDELRARWLDRVVELQPLFQRSIGVVLALVMAPLVGLLVASVQARMAEGVRRWAWAFLALWIAAGLGLALLQTRWIMYPQLLAGVPIAFLLQAGREWLTSRSRILQVVGSLALVLVGVFGWRVFVGLPQEPGEPPSAEPCAVSATAAVIEPSSVVLAAIDQGPEILWRTEASVVASPYHRNVDGILDTLDAFEGDEAVAKSIVDARGIDTVLVCPGVDGKDYAGGPDSLYMRLVKGDAPPWMRPVGEFGSFQMYRVETE